MSATSSLVVASTFIGLTALGWLMFVIGFGIGRTDTPLLFETPNSYPYWIVSIVGPLIFITAIFHLFTDKMYSPYAPAVSRICGAIVSALKSPPDGLGMILYVLRILICTFNEAGGAQSIPIWVKLAFGGSVDATVSWTVVIILCHFNNVGKSDE